MGVSNASHTFSGFFYQFTVITGRWAQGARSTGPLFQKEGLRVARGGESGKQVFLQKFGAGI